MSHAERRKGQIARLQVLPERRRRQDSLDADEPPDDGESGWHSSGHYFKDVLLRISEPGTDVKSLTPHGWKEKFEPEVTARRHDILKKLVGAA